MAEPGSPGRRSTASTTAHGRRGSAALGRSGEDLAADLLTRAGYRILDRNWRDGRCEIDFVAIRSGQVVFVEVKTRRPGPQPVCEAVAPAQRRNIRRTAAAWMRRHPRVGASFRFDVIGFTWPRDGDPEVTYIPGAFEANDPW